jgi:hypothetical protein
MLDYSVLSKEELESEISDIEYNIIQLHQRNKEDEVYINRYASAINRCKNEISGLTELKDKLQDIKIKKGEDK